MDVEYAIENGKVFITQARPETVHATRTVLTLFKLKAEPKVAPLYIGIPVGTKIASGLVAKADTPEEAVKEIIAFNKKGSEADACYLNDDSRLGSCYESRKSFCTNL